MKDPHGVVLYRAWNETRPRGRSSSSSAGRSRWLFSSGSRTRFAPLRLDALLVANAELQKENRTSIFLAQSPRAHKTGSLPPTSRKVPGDLAAVSEKGFASTAADWSDDAFACDGFRVRDPQRFQYEWVKTSDTEGTATARADFNGDGVVEATFEQELKCENKNGKLRCGPGAFKDQVLTPATVIVGLLGSSTFVGKVATTAVHDGKSATPGTSSTASAMRMRHENPSVAKRITATTTSSTSSGIESAPSPKTGKNPSWIKSARPAMTSATFFFDSSSPHAYSLRGLARRCALTRLESALWSCRRKLKTRSVSHQGRVGARRWMMPCAGSRSKFPARGGRGDIPKDGDGLRRSSRRARCRGSDHDRQGGDHE